MGGDFRRTDSGKYQTSKAGQVFFCGSVAFWLPVFHSRGPQHNRASLSHKTPAMTNTSDSELIRYTQTCIMQSQPQRKHSAEIDTTKTSRIKTQNVTSEKCGWAKILDGNNKKKADPKKQLFTVWWTWVIKKQLSSEGKFWFEKKDNLKLKWTKQRSMCELLLFKRCQNDSHFVKSPKAAKAPESWTKCSGFSWPQKEPAFQSVIFLMRSVVYVLHKHRVARVSLEIIFRAKRGT